jgi:hypothetical protein
MCTVLLPPGIKPIALNKYMSYHHHYQNTVLSVDCRYDVSEQIKKKFFVRLNLQLDTIMRFLGYVSRNSKVETLNKQVSPKIV